MPFVRSLSVFVLSLVFTSFIFMSLTYYALGPLVQKDSMKGFLDSEGSKFIGIQCGTECKSVANQSDCLSDCKNYNTNQTIFIVDHATDELYQKSFFGMSMNDISSQAQDYVTFLILGLIFGALLIAASKTPLSTIGKDLLSVALALLLLVIVLSTVMLVVNLPLNLGADFISYLSPGTDKVERYGIYLLVIGLAMIVINRIIHRKPKEDSTSS